MTTWIRLIKDDDKVELAFNSRMMDVHQGSNLDQIVDGMIVQSFVKVYFTCRARMMINPQILEISF